MKGARGRRGSGMKMGEIVVGKIGGRVRGYVWLNRYGCLSETGEAVYGNTVVTSDLTEGGDDKVGEL